MEFIKAFEEIDKDESGEITRSELEEYMKAKNYKPAFVEKWMKIFDIDNSGTISMEEFCNTLGLIPGKKQKERIQRRNTLKKIEIENKNKLNEENTQIQNSSYNNSRTVSRSITVTIENSKHTTTQSFSGSEHNKSPENGSIKDTNLTGKGKLKETDTNDSDFNSKPYDHIISLSTSVGMAETDGKSQILSPSIKPSKEIDQKETETVEDIVEYERMITRFKRIIIPNDEIYVISEDPDMTDSLRNFVLNLSLDSARRFNEPLEMAKCIKRILDFNFNRSWHVVAGKESYGCLVTHEEGRFIHVRAREWGILMWQILKI